MCSYTRRRLIKYDLRISAFRTARNGRGESLRRWTTASGRMEWWWPANPAPPSRDARITTQFDTDVYRGIVWRYRSRIISGRSLLRFSRNHFRKIATIIYVRKVLLSTPIRLPWNNSLLYTVVQKQSRRINFDDSSAYLNYTFLKWGLIFLTTIVNRFASLKFHSLYWIDDKNVSIAWRECTGWRAKNGQLDLAVGSKIAHYTLAQSRQILTDFSVHCFGYVEQSVGCVCVCVCVCVFVCLCIWTETVNLNGRWPRYLAS